MFKWHKNEDNKTVSVESEQETQKKLIEKERTYIEAFNELAAEIRAQEDDSDKCSFDCPKADEPVSCTACTLGRALAIVKERHTVKLEKPYEVRYRECNITVWHTEQFYDIESAQRLIDECKAERYDDIMLLHFEDNDWKCVWYKG